MYVGRDASTKSPTKVPAHRWARMAIAMAVIVDNYVMLAYLLNTCTPDRDRQAGASQAENVPRQSRDDGM